MSQDSMRTFFISFSLCHSITTESRHFNSMWSGAICAWKTGKRKMEVEPDSSSHQQNRLILQNNPLMQQLWGSDRAEVEEPNGTFQSGQTSIQALRNTLKYLATLCLVTLDMHWPPSRPREGQVTSQSSGKSHIQEHLIKGILVFHTTFIFTCGPTVV